MDPVTYMYIELHAMRNSVEPTDEDYRKVIRAVCHDQDEETMFQQFVEYRSQLNW